MRSALLPALLLAPGLLGSCRSSSPAPGVPAEPPALELPPDWPSLSPIAFERFALDALPSGQTSGVPLSPAALAELAGALEAQDQASLRAAVLLGRSRTLEASRILLERLERRVPAEARAGDAADVVASAALPLLPPSLRRELDVAARLSALGSGPSPHPDLEVRVECALGALTLGRDEGIPFLLQVLLIGTPAGESEPRDFEPSPTTAWARGRAARGLSERAGVPLRYRTDASLAEREREAASLAAHLGP